MCSLFCCCLCTVCSLVSVALMLALLLLSFSRLCTVWSLVSVALMLALLLLSFSRLCTVWSPVSVALMLDMCSLFCCCLCTVCSLVSDAHLLAFCNLSLAFLADLTLSDCKTCMRFVAVSGKLCSAFLLARKTRWQDLNTFSLIGTIDSHCGHTLLGGMIEKSATHGTGARGRLLTT